MLDIAIAWEWMEFAIRWLHVITAMAWIGSSFYFIALDLGLRAKPDMPEGVQGEEWQVHGGGFYHIQKYTVAPDHLPEHLKWFKWESYSTWISGMALMAVLYYVGADLYLVDPDVLDIPPYVAILISLFSLAVGWIAYDLICKSPLGGNATLLMVILFVILVAVAWGYAQVFSGRAAMLHLGAYTATIMSANVFFIIIPNQRIVMADLIAHRTPDPKLGKMAKQRSTHNNYLTLPVLFLMLSNHYPLSFASEFNWLIAAMIFLMGVSIRHFFNSYHSGGQKPLWTWLVTAILFILIVWLSSKTQFVDGEDEIPLDIPAVGKVERFANSNHFPEVRDIVLGRCSMCHAKEPFWEGIYWPPGNVVLDTDERIARQARSIYLHAGLTNAMPPANASFMEPHERLQIVTWYRDVEDSIRLNPISGSVD